MTDRRQMLILGLAGGSVIAVGLTAEWLAHGTRLGFAAQRDLLTGWLVAAAGLVAWARVPRSRIGPLLVGVGLTWFIGTVADPRTLPGQVSAALTFVYVGVLVHAVLTWPTGRPRGSLDRMLVIGGYLVALFSPLWERDSGLLVIAALLALALAGQWLSQPLRLRRARTPAVIVGFGLALALGSKSLVAGYLRRQGVAYPGDPESLWQIALVVASAALAWSLIALERRARAATDLVVSLGAEGSIPGAADLAAAAGLPDESSSREALSRAAAMSERNRALRDELSAQATALEASRRRLLVAEDEEREALEARLRAGPRARLADLGIRLEDARRGLAPGSTEPAARLDRASVQLALALDELDELARGLDPALLRERGLAEALVHLAGRSPVPVDVVMQPLVLSQPGIERSLFYVASEALANVAKHAQASRAWLTLTADERAVALSVDDDGIGPRELMAGSGLRGLRDRVETLGGFLDITGRSGQGTRLRAVVPLGGADEASLR
jgi:signal transduction histidine kinase